MPAPPAIIPEDEEDERQLRFLLSTAADAGMARYAAAMHFFMKNKLSAAELERYRVVSKDGANSAGRHAGD